MAKVAPCSATRQRRERQRESEEGWSTHLGVDPGADGDVEQAEDGDDGEVARDVLDEGNVGEVGGPGRGHGSDDGLRTQGRSICSEVGCGGMSVEPGAV